MSGKRKQNTIKSTTFSDGQGRMPLAGVVRPGRMHDQTAVRTEGIAEQFRPRPRVKAKADSGYAGLAKTFPGQVTAPPKKPNDEACDGEKRAWREARRRQSPARIRVEHTSAELRQWAPLRRFTGRRETYAETHLAIAGLVSDRAAQRPTRRQTSTELVLARCTTCRTGYRKAVAQYKATRDAFLAEVTGGEHHGNITEIGRAFGAALNALDSRTPFIETVEREELFDALDFLADEAQTAAGRDLTAARAALIEGVDSIRDW